MLSSAGDDEWWQEWSPLEMTLPVLFDAIGLHQVLWTVRKAAFLPGVGVTEAKGAVVTEGQGVAYSAHADLQSPMRHL